MNVCLLVEGVLSYPDTQARAATLAFLLRAVDSTAIPQIGNTPSGFVHAA
jgi:hypothetical protein